MLGSAPNMTNLLRSLLGASVVVGATLATWPAEAQTSSAKGRVPVQAAKEAADLKRVGDDAMASLRFSEALVAYDRAYAQDRNPALLYNRGRALQLLDRLPEALLAFEQFKREATPELLQKVPKFDELLEEIRGKVGTLEVGTALEGVLVLVDGRAVGTTPLSEPVRLKRGTDVLVELRKEGYHTVERHLDFTHNGVQRLTIEPELKDKTALLLVASPVAGASVRIDGRDVGHAPSESYLPPGPHKVVVGADGYDDAELSVVLEAGQRRPVDVPLQPSTPLYKRWWFWTAIGAAVATGVGFGIAYSTEGPAGTGDIAPGQLAAPLVSF
jgi:hypothetical protein